MNRIATIDMIKKTATIGAGPARDEDDDTLVVPLDDESEGRVGVVVSFCVPDRSWIAAPYDGDGDAVEGESAVVFRTRGLLATSNAMRGQPIG